MVSQRSLESKTKIRLIENHPYITDNSNYIIDCKFDKIYFPNKLSVEINSIPGVVDNGLFVNLVDLLIVGNDKGDVEIF